MAGYRLIVVFWLLLLFSWEAFAETSKPRWKELKPEQQKILEPLAEYWDTMERVRKKKWLAITKRYSKMNLQEQQRIQSKMQRWHALTSEQRKQARERYKKLEQLPERKRQEIRQRWYEYEQLPEGPGNSSRILASAVPE